jgi:hypothetical protein
MEEARRRFLFGHVVSGVTTVLCLGVGAYLRQWAGSDFKDWLLPPAHLALELAALMVVILMEDLARPATGSKRHLYYVAAAMGLIVATAWVFVWGVGSPWDASVAFGKAVAIYIPAAVPLAATAWTLGVVGREEWLSRSVIAPLIGFAGALATVPISLALVCALNRDCV